MKRALLLCVLLGFVPTAGVAQSSKTVYAQAKREAPGSQRSIDLFTRYVTLEPKDAWGFLALAETHAAARNFDEAFAALTRAETLAPGEEDVRIVRSRINRLHRASLPSIKPTVFFGRDTDSNTSFTIGAAGDVALSSSARAGVSGLRTSTSDGFVNGAVDRGAATLAVKSGGLRWTTEVGAARISHDSARNVMVGQTHLRWSAASQNSFVADVRVRRAPVTSSYSLLFAEAVLTEARASIDIPLGSRLKLRGLGQLGSIETNAITTTTEGGRENGGRATSQTNVERNQRIGVGGAVVGALSRTSEVSLLGYRLGYERASSGQYFAPQHVDMIELGTYTEIYRFDPLTIAFDAGAGVQRAQLFGEAAGEITPALRFWGQASVPLTPFVELNAEIDYYKSQLNTVTTNASWSSLAGGVSLRWLIR